MLEGKASWVSKSFINLKVKLKKRYLRKWDFEVDLSLLLFLEKEVMGPFHSSCSDKKLQCSLCMQNKREESLWGKVKGKQDKIIFLAIHTNWIGNGNTEGKEIVKLSYILSRATMWSSWREFPGHQSNMQELIFTPTQHFSNNWRHHGRLEEA